MPVAGFEQRFGVLAVGADPAVMTVEPVDHGLGDACGDGMGVGRNDHGSCPCRLHVENCSTGEYSGHDGGER